MLIALIVFLGIVLSLTLFLFFRALKKISFYEHTIRNFATDFGEEVEFLVDYCRGLKKKDILLDSPEVRQFVDIVKAVENSFEALLNELKNHRENREENFNETEESR